MTNERKPSDSPESSPKDQTPSPKKRRGKKGCLIFCFVGFLVFIGAILFVAGPGFRILGKIGVLHLAESEGLQGDLELKGNLWSGFSLEEMEFSSESSPVQNLSLEQARVRYRFSDLVFHFSEYRWLEIAAIQGLDVSLVIPETGEKKPADGEASSFPKKRTPTDFSPFWNLLRSDISLTDISANVTVGEKNYVLQNFAIALPPGESGYLALEDLTIPGVEGLEGFRSPITVTERKLTFQSIPLPEGIVIRKLAVEESAPGVFSAEIEVTVADATILAKGSSAGKVNLSLGSGQVIELEKVAQLFGKDLPLGGKIETMHLSFDGDFARPSSWNLDGAIVSSELRWEDLTIDQARVDLAGENASITISRPDARAQFKAHIPLSLIHDAESLATAPVSLDGELSVSSLTPFLEAFAPELPLQGSIEGKIAGFQLVDGKSVQSGSALFQLNDATWDGVALGPVQMAARVSAADKIDFRSDFAFSDLNTGAVQGAFDTAALTYEASASLKASTDEKLLELLAKMEAADKFQGDVVVDWKGSGNVKEAKHQGAMDLRAPSLTLLSGEVFEALVSAKYEGDRVDISTLSLTRDEVQITGTASLQDNLLVLPGLSVKEGDVEKMTLSARVPLPEKSEENSPATPASIDESSGSAAPANPDISPSGNEAISVKLNANELAISTLAKFATADLPMDGNLTGELTLDGILKNLATAARFEFVPLEKTAGENSKLSFTLNHRGDPQSPETWEMDLDALMSGLKWNETALEEMSLQAKTVDEGGSKRAIADLSINQSTAKIDVNASVGLNGVDEISTLAKKSVAVSGDIHIERIQQLIQDFAGEVASSIPLTGTLVTTLSDFEITDGHLEKGRFELKSENLALADDQIGELDIQGNVTARDQLEAALALPLDEISTIEGSIEYGLVTGEYSGELTVEADLKSKGRVRDLLADRNFAELLPKETSLIWKGKGKVTGEPEHQGEFSFSGDGLTLAGDSPPIALSVEGTYTEDSANLSKIEIDSDPIQLSGSLQWIDGLLTIPKIVGLSADKEVLSINASIPLKLEKLEPEAWFQQEEPISLNLTATNLAIERIMKIAQPKPPVAGNLDCTLKVSGTPSQPEIAGDLKLSEIVVPQEKKDLPVGELIVNLEAANEQVAVNGSFTHPDINPFLLKAALPFFPGEWASGKREFSDEKLTASVAMEKSSLSFLITQVPEIEDIAGTIALDVDVSGSINEPRILGNGVIDVSKLRLQNRNAPTFYDIDTEVRFADETIIVEKLRAIVAGGTVELSGNASLSGESPVLNFSLKGDEVLVARTPDVNVRTDVDITLTGPWEKAALSGSLGITNSRFFKNVDLLPIGLPSRNRSAIPTVERVPSGGGPASTDLDIGVPIEPFKDWPVDIRIYTKDPFLIRGNLAESSIESDLRIVGTLGKPVPVGTVNIEEGTLSLPFSTVDVEVGEIVFSEKTGFNGALEFKARAQAGDYKINIYAYNRILAPKHVLTSIPPLPPEDIITLIATGTTRDDFTGSDAGSVAASKAAMLFIKNLRKSGAGVDREPSLLDKIQDRTELEVGKINPETGEQTFGGKVRLWKRLFFVGDVDSQSDYRALLKYVFQFR